MKIPLIKFRETIYPCKNKYNFLYLFMISPLVVLVGLLSIKACVDGHPFFLVILFLISVFIVSIYNFVIIFRDRIYVVKILNAVKMKQKDASDIWEYLEYRKEGMLHFSIRRRPEVLLLIGKMLEHYSILQKDSKKLVIAHNLINVSVKYNSHLLLLANNSELSFVARKIEDLFLARQHVFPLNLLRHIFRIALIILFILLIAALIINVIGIITKLLR